MAGNGRPAGTLSWVTPTGHAYDDPTGTHPIDGINCAEITTTAEHTDSVKIKIKTRVDPDPPPF